MEIERLEQELHCEVENASQIRIEIKVKDLRLRLGTWVEEISFYQIF